MAFPYLPEIFLGKNRRSILRIRMDGVKQDVRSNDYHLGQPAEYDYPYTTVGFRKESLVPDIKEEFTVKAPIEAAWQLLSDMEKLAHCVPGCQSARQVAENEFDWVLAAKLLRTSRTINIRTRASEITPPHHVSFLGDGKLMEGMGFYKLTLRGVMDLQPISDNETWVIFDGNVGAAGPGGALINKIASAQMKDLLRDFEQNVRNELEKPPDGR